MNTDCWCNSVGKKRLIVDDGWHCKQCHMTLVPEDYPHTCTTCSNWTTWIDTGNMYLSNDAGQLGSL